MLISEYDYEMDIAVQRAEEHEIAFAEGIEQGKSLGLAEGSRRKALETAKNLLAMGLSIENIVKATGLTVQEVESARSVCQDD